MRFETLYQIFKTAKATSELAYLLGFLGGKKREVRQLKKLERHERRLDR